MLYQIPQGSKLSKFERSHCATSSKPEGGNSTTTRHHHILWKFSLGKHSDLQESRTTEHEKGSPTTNTPSQTSAPPKAEPSASPTLGISHVCPQSAAGDVCCFCAGLVLSNYQQKPNKAAISRSSMCRAWSSGLRVESSGSSA